MSSSAALKKFFTAGRPLVEQQIAVTRSLNLMFMDAWKSGQLDSAWTEFRAERSDLWLTYYIRARGTGDIKIGKSNHVRQRMISLWTGASRGLDLIACYPASVNHEAEIKEEFSSLRLCGEWYRAGGELLTHLQLIGCDVDVFSDEPLSAFPSRSFQHFMRGLQ